MEAFRHVDSHGDTVAPGALRKLSLMQSPVLASGRDAFAHGDETARGKMPIGIWTHNGRRQSRPELTGKLALRTKPVLMLTPVKDAGPGLHSTAVNRLPRQGLRVA